MKLLKYRLMVTTLLLAAIITAVPSGAYAASSVTHTINGIDIYGSVSIEDGYASARIFASEPVYMTVTFEYTYGIAGTRDDKTIQTFDSGFKSSLSANLSAAEFSSTSISAVVTFSAIVDGEEWKRTVTVKP